MAYFLTGDSTPKGRDPNINIIDGIHKIKDRTSVNILVSTPINTLHFTKENTLDTLNQQSWILQIKRIYITQTVSHWRKWCLKPLHPTPLIHHDMNFLQLYKIILNCYYRVWVTICQRQNSNRHHSFDKHDNRYWHCQPSFPKTLSYSYETLSMGERRNWEVTCHQSYLHQLLQLVSIHYRSTERQWRKMFGNRL